MENRQTADDINKISETDNLTTRLIFFAAILICIAGLFYFSSIDHSEPIDNSEPVFIEEWNVTGPDGNTFKAGSSYRNDEKKNGIFTMVSSLPRIASDDHMLCFITGGDVSVYINGELRKDFIASRDMVIPGGCVKRFYMLVPLTSADSEAEVKIIRNSISRSGYVYQNTFVTDGSGFFGFMISRYGLSVILEAILLIFSIVIVIISIIMMLLYKRQIEMLYGAMSIFVIAAWLITNSYLYPFLFGHYHIDGVMNYMLCLMMPFSLAFYLDDLQHGRYHRIMIIVVYISTFNLFVWPILHFTGMYSFPDALILIDAFLGIELLTVAGVLAADFIRGGIKEYKYTAIGFSGFMICGLIEIIALNFITPINGDIMMLTGLAFLLALTVVQQMVDLRKVREEGLRAVSLSEAKTRFLASMSHEIRTPINAVLGMNEMILRENKDPVIGEYASSVKSSGKMLLMLVNDVLDFSKIEAGKMEINCAEFTMSSVLKDIMPMLRERADEKNLKLQMILLNEVPDKMISDEFRIRQILINLINNAIKYTDSGSVSLMLGGEYTGDDSYMFKMCVRDTGRGIKDEDQQHLFEAFSRADIKKNRSIEGTGLGLAIVKSIVDSMEGEISVISKYGEGSEFIVHFPVKVSDRTPLSEDYEKHEQEPITSDNGGDYLAPEARVLAVDDNSSNLKIVKLFLKHIDIIPDLCDSGSKAIDMCREKHYDLILLDHMMPDPDGIKTLEIIKTDTDSLNRDTPAIVLTANAIAGSAKTYADAGFTDYLTKPIDSSLLEQTIRKYLPADKIFPADKNSYRIVTAPEKNNISRSATAAEKSSMSLDVSAAAAIISDNTLSFRQKLESIGNIDYDTSLKNVGGNEDLLKEMVRIISSGSDESIRKMREAYAAQNWEDYSLIAHTLKGMMASVGYTELSERAKKHEYAAENNDIDFLRADFEDFLTTYHDVCALMKQISA